MERSKTSAILSLVDKKSVNLEEELKKCKKEIDHLIKKFEIDFIYDENKKY